MQKTDHAISLHSYLAYTSSYLYIEVVEDAIVFIQNVHVVSIFSNSYSIINLLQLARHFMQMSTIRFEYIWLALGWPAGRSCIYGSID